jgi:uncharacterized protein (DUF885 family)
MRSALLPCIAFSLTLAACGVAPPSPSQSADQRFRAHVAKVLEEYWAEAPDSAVRMGDYHHAGEQLVPDAAQRARTRDFDRRQLAALQQFDAASLSPANRIDLAILKNRFERSLWQLDTFKAWQWDPSSYNVANTLDLVLTTDYAPIEVRLRNALARLEKMPAYYAAARASIADPTLEHTQLAILQNKGALRILTPELMKQVDASSLTPAEKALFIERVHAARAAINDYIAFLTHLESQLRAGHARSFRIGRALYEQKFRYDIQSHFTAEQLYRRAMADKAALHDSMEKLARELWPKYMGSEPMPADRLVMIRAVLGEIAKHHVAREDFVDAVRRQLARLSTFVREKDLVDQDPTRPLVVRETPIYLRGIAGASISAPGPLNPTANTYYNVSPLDDMSPEAAESFLREYNDWTLQILNIHEAIPGHYTQLMHANKSPSLVPAVFANGSMIEGWAVYGEKMMLDAGYGGGAPEMWLMWMKWNLRSVMNTILDYEIQTMDLSREDAIRMMTREAFQEDTEATEKWRRASLTQVQLTSYFNGYTEITALRDEMRAKEGAAFSVKRFNNAFLSHGNAPVRYIRELMISAP